MSANTSASAGQLAAEALMSDTFAAYSPSGRTAQNETNGLEEPELDPQGSTFGKVQGPSQQTSDTATRTVLVGNVERDVITGGLHIPLSAPKPENGWEYVCTATGPNTPAGLLGVRYRVINVPLKSWMTAYRLDVIEV